MAEIRGIFDYIREALGEQISPIGSAYSKFLELPVDARRGLISQDFRQKVENMPTAPYTGDGNFQGVLGSTQAEKIDGYSGSDPTDYDISGENISNADKFVAESILGTGDILTQPDVIGKELVDIGSGLLQKATGEVTNQEQVDKANIVQDSVASLFTPEGFNKSMYETGGAVALPVGGAYLGLKGAQLSKSLFNKGVQPGMSIKDISARKQGEITAPIDDYGFYDPIEQLLMDLPQEVNTRGDIKRYLLKRGVKRDQILESKLDDYMEGKELRGQQITKEGLLNQINKDKTTLLETTLAGSEGANRLVLDRPQDDGFNTYHVTDAEGLREEISNRNPSDRNWEALDDQEYIDARAEDFADEVRGHTLSGLKVAGGFMSDRHLVKQLNEVAPDRYPLTQADKMNMELLDDITLDLEGTGQTTLDFMPEWYREQFSTKVPEDVIEKLAKHNAEYEYWNNPYYEWKVKTTDGDEYRVVGNEELGLQIYRPSGEKFDDVVYSIDEAEILVNQDAMDYGYMSYADGSTQYEDYMGPAKNDLNMNTYEEVLVTAPHLGEDFYGSHFSDYVNTTAHIRMADTKDGKRKKVIEIQSDVHQKGRQNNYDTEEFRKKHEEYRKREQAPTEERLVDIQDERQELLNQHGKIYTSMKDGLQKLKDEGKIRGFHDYSGGDLDVLVGKEGVITFNKDGELYSFHTSVEKDIEKYRKLIEPYAKQHAKAIKLIDKKNELGNVVVDLEDKLAEMINPTTVPDVPQKNERWVQDAVYRAINRAREEGKDGVEFVDSEYSLDIWNPNRVKNEDGKVKYQELYQNVYDKKVPSTLKKYKNKYGGEVEKLEGGGYYYKFDDKSRDVKGIPLASTGGLLSIDQMQDDDKMNNKQGLLA